MRHNVFVKLATLVALLGALTLGAAPAGAADFYFTTCEAEVYKHQVTFKARICNADADGATATAAFFVTLSTATAPGATPSATRSVTLSGNTCQNISAPVGIFPYVTLPNNHYKLWCRADFASDTNPDNNLMGPTKFAVGPDLWVYRFWHKVKGDTVDYYAVVCNTGTDIARNFRVGFYYNRATAPLDGDYSDSFKSLTELHPAYYWWGDTWFRFWLCQEVTVKRTPTPEGTYKSWVKVDEGLFVEESNETNNVGPSITFTLAYPDLVIERFDAKVTPTRPHTITWQVLICNKGRATAKNFWADIYWDRPSDDPPQVGQPGDDNKGWKNLGPGACEYHEFTRTNVDPTSATRPPYETWVQVDADDFVGDPNRDTNLEGPLDIRVPGGVVTGCVDNDGDGYGVGDKCLGPQDCNDNDPSIHPGAPEICGDGIDQNCNVTPDDGCPGVDCTDGDGDGWPVGPDCVVEDCNDNDPTIYPGAPEICGDGIDQDCDGIPDDCCPGVNCCDADNDGFGVGSDCPGPQDCDDGNPAAHSVDSPEICGDNKDNNCNGLIDENCPGTYCVDADGDGFGVGVGCNGPQDCNDSDPTIYPGAPETCDGIDNNCNRIIDEGCPGCTDYDGDGYGVGDDCEPGERDCDESNPNVYPGAPELCDGIDNNCNFTVDDGTPSSQCPNPLCVAACNGNATCIAACPIVDCIDHDGDGWGVGSDCVIEDCDDDNASIHPGAKEVCDLIDNNCTGTPDEGTPGNPCPNVQCVIGCAGDQACIAACPIQDCIDHDGDGWGVGPDCVVEDPDDTDPSIYPGAPEICGDGIDQSGSGVADDGCVLCIDHDGDGYGVGPFCDVRDCNDNDPNIYPGAPEVCGTKDMNCDGIPPVKPCEACSCSHGGSNPLSHWPTATFFLLLLGVLLRRARR